jgi:hypothetical protein
MKKNIFLVVLLLSVFLNRVNPYPRNVLLEFSSSTSCSYCPCMDSVVNKILINQFPGLNPISYHSVEPIDPFANFKGKEIINLLNIINLPSAQVDRILNSSANYDSIIAKINLRYTNYPTTPIGITVTNKTYNTSTGEFSIAYNLTSSQTLSGKYFAQLIIYENNLIYPQSPGICGGGSDFVHNFVARELSYDDVYGDTIVNGTWNANQVITKNYSTAIKSSWTLENCNFLIVVYELTSPGTLLRAEVQQSYRGSIANSIGISKENDYVNDYSLLQNYPNPFNPTTNIKFSIPKNNFVELKIYNILGKEITTLFRGFLKQGLYNVEFDASKLSSGTYFYKLKTKDFTATKKMVLIK